jgi:hypothetical protein
MQAFLIWLVCNSMQTHFDPTTATPPVARPFYITLLYFALETCFLANRL